MAGAALLQTQAQQAGARRFRGGRITFARSSAKFEAGAEKIWSGIAFLSC